MADIRYAASKLIDLAGVSDPSRIAFLAGGGAFLEALKITRRHSDEWMPETCPVVDPAKTYLLLSLPLNHSAALPVDALTVMIDGKPFMSAFIDLSAGCAGGIPPPVVKESLVEATPPKRSVFSRNRSAQK